MDAKPFSCLPYPFLCFPSCHLFLIYFLKANTSHDDTIWYICIHTIKCQKFFLIIQILEFSLSNWGKNRILECMSHYSKYIRLTTIGVRFASCNWNSDPDSGSVCWKQIQLYAKYENQTYISAGGGLEF